MSPALLALSLLLVILLGLYLAAPRCPRCGSVEASIDELLPQVRRCRRCAEVYEIKR